MATEGEPVANSNKKTEDEPLYFTRDGKPRFGITPPSAFAFSYPYPPLPSNLGKNKVLRAVDEQARERQEEGIAEAEKEFEKEAMPLPTLPLRGSPLPKILIPEIELAIYWDRHPYEFRPEKEKENHKQNVGGSIRRTQSEMNLASKVGEILQTSSVSHSGSSNHSRKSSAGTSRHSHVSALTVASSLKNLALQSEPQLADSNSKDNRCEEQSVDNPHESAIQRENGIERGKSPRPAHMSESERKKFKDIVQSSQRNPQNDKHNHRHGAHSRPKLIRTQDQLDRIDKKSAGIQVTLDDVADAALKSTYLCPLHGQYRRGVERRDRGGFRTDMSSIPKPHMYCSRALKGITSKTKLIKTAETQTESEIAGDQVSDTRAKRSKTAGHLRHHPLSKGIKDIMASEYHGSFRDPYKIADSEKRHLRNKILNYCFTKHSIF